LLGVARRKQPENQRGFGEHAMTDQLVESVRDIKTKSQALDYCLKRCLNGPDRGVPQKSRWINGCALNCELRKKWRIPPHGKKYYSD
jgi:hypothetical protein